MDSQQWTTQHNDPLFRETGITDPTGQTITISYTRGLNNNSTSTSQPFQAMTMKHGLYYNGFGMPVVEQTWNGSSYDTLIKKYDGLGRLIFVSTPFTCSSSPYSCSSAIGTTISYDALGRVLTQTDANGGIETHTYTQGTSSTGGLWEHINVSPTPSGDRTTGDKSKIILTNGIGQITEECFINGYSDATACGGPFGGNGYKTTYEYNPNGDIVVVYKSSASTSQQHKFQYDGLHRLTSETFPETGTRTFIYDYIVSVGGSGVCPQTTFPGAIVQIKDNKGGLFCPTYDAFGRIAQITYNGDPNTDTVGFSYDTGANGGGKLAQAWTCLGSQNPNSCPIANALTAETFNYDTRGNISNYNETSPLIRYENSGGWVSVNEVYDALDRPLSIILGNYNLWTASAWDNEGRPTKVVGGSNPQIPLQISATYGLHTAAAGPSSVTYGNLDTVTTNYDNVGHIVSEQIALGGSAHTQSDSLVWNANGTLGSITRSCSATDASCLGNTNASSITATYNYDELMRTWKAASTGDGGQLNQTFGYDVFDNIQSANGTPTMFNNGANSSNQLTNAADCASGGQQGPCYDANGRVTIDERGYQYTWDVNGKLVGSGNNGQGTYIRDAFGRAIDEPSGGANIWIPGVGNPLNIGAPGYGWFMNALPLPGGSAVEANAFYGYEYGFNHKDYLGNSVIHSYYDNNSQAGRFLFSQNYAPFGLPYDATGGDGDPAEQGFNGAGNLLNSTSLWDTPARELDSTAGRWISPDPIRQGWNLYTFGNNRPTSITDPYGLDPDPDSSAGGDDTGGNPTFDLSLSYNADAVTAEATIAPTPDSITVLPGTSGMADALVYPGAAAGDGASWSSVLNGNTNIMTGGGNPLNGADYQSITNNLNSFISRHPIFTQMLVAGIVGAVIGPNDPQPKFEDYADGNEYRRALQEWRWARTDENTARLQAEKAAKMGGGDPIAAAKEWAHAQGGMVNGVHFIEGTNSLTYLAEGESEFAGQAYETLVRWQTTPGLRIEDAIKAQGSERFTNFFTNLGDGAGSSDKWDLTDPYYGSRKPCIFCR
jgi:RHS repeat-associated protein